MLKAVVHAEDGLGRAARVAGFEIGGKTGTSQKAAVGGYGGKYVASFIGMVPAQKPRYLVLVLVDEPKKSIYGAAVAAPAFRELVTQTLAYRGLSPEESAGMFAGTDKEKSAVDTGFDSMELDLTAYIQNKAREAVTSKLQLRLTSGPLTLADADDSFTGRFKLPPPGPQAQTEAGAGLVPDVRGMSVRSAVELFAREAIMPVLKGQGSTVARQSPEPGTKWSYQPDAQYVLWLEEKTL
jgi:cell division protein FtsI (penicillin-binding protein 3)